MSLMKNLKHRIDMLMNELHNTPKFGQIDGCLERTCNHIQRHFSMLISCGQSDSSNQPFALPKSLVKMGSEAEKYF